MTRAEGQGTDHDSDADSQESETFHLLHLSSTDVDGDVCLLLFSKMNDQLLIKKSTSVITKH